MQPIKRVPIVQQVEQQIREMIESGRYEPGHKLPAEKELCQTLSVGRGTIREAFRLLQARGYVELKPGRGAFVAEALPEDMGAVEWLVQNEHELLDAIEIRQALEPIAARRMAERGDHTAAQALKALHARFLEAIEKEDAAQIALLDEIFHSTIVEGSGNHLLIAINQQVCQGTKPFRSKTFQIRQNVQNAVRPHTSILQAILDGDGEAAEREMRSHLDKVQEDLADNIAAPSAST